jgi:hypothetical protein
LAKISCFFLGVISWRTVEHISPLALWCLSFKRQRRRKAAAAWKKTLCYTRTKRFESLTYNIISFTTVFFSCWQIEAVVFSLSLSRCHNLEPGGGKIKNCWEKFKNQNVGTHSKSSCVNCVMEKVLQKVVCQRNEKKNRGKYVEQSRLFIKNCSMLMDMEQLTSW